MTKNPNLVSDTIIMAAISALGYLTAYFYEYGYLSYFDIPRQLIEIKFNKYHNCSCGNYW